MLYVFDMCQLNRNVYTITCMAMSMLGLVSCRILRLMAKS
jgi:hypothetical protein